MPDLLEQTISDLLEQLVASLSCSSTLLQDDNNLFNPDLSTTWNKQCEHILLTSCETFTRAFTLLPVCKQVVQICSQAVNKLLQICSQVVDKLCSHFLFPVIVTSLEQAVNKL